MLHKQRKLVIIFNNDFGNYWQKFIGNFHIAIGFVAPANIGVKNPKMYSLDKLITMKSKRMQECGYGHVNNSVMMCCNLLRWIMTSSTLANSLE